MVQDLGGATHGGQPARSRYMRAERFAAIETEY
jgi:hypothetical protein